MFDFIPLFQSLFWPLTILIIVFTFKTRLVHLVEAIVKRIERGDSFSLGTEGIKLETPKQAAADASSTTPPELKENLPSEIYLRHDTRRARDRDIDGRKYFRIRIYLDADEPRQLDEVASVTYYLHPTFRDPVRHVPSRETDFALATLAWGEFNLRAKVYFNDSSRPPLDLERFIDF